jgi:hypothetical protein
MSLYARRDDRAGIMNLHRNGSGHACAARPGLALARRSSGR